MKIPKYAHSINTNFFRLKCQAIVILLSLYVFTAPAAELIMINGDRLTGTVESLGKGVFKFRTEYAGVITVEWDKVESLTTEKEVIVLTNDDQMFRGTLVAKRGKIIKVQKSDGQGLEALEDNIAYINPEDWRIGKATKHSGHANFALKLDWGSSDNDTLDIDFDHVARKKSSRASIYGQLEYDTSKGVKTEDKWSVLAKQDWFVEDSKRFYSFSGFAEHNWSKGIELRYNIGPSIGYQLWESDEKNMSLEWGLYWVSTNLQNEDTYSNPGTGWRIIYDQYLYKNFLQAYHRQSSILSNRENMNFKSVTGLRIPIHSGFLASAELEVNWDALTAEEMNDGEIISRLKLGYGW